MIYIFILALIIAITVIYYIFKNKIKENFNNKVHYLSIEESCEFIRKNHVKYFNSFNKKDTKLRGCTSIKTCYDNYCENVLEFNEEDKKNLIYLINKVKPVLLKYFPKMEINSDWKFIKFHTNLESGLPHTIEDCIVLSTYFTRNLNKSIRNNENFENIMEYFGETLIHERIHVYQKKYPDYFNNLYNNYWNFNYLHNIKLSDRIIQNLRSNPDGQEIKWGFKYKDIFIVPVAIFKENASKINHVQYYGILYKNNQYIGINKLEDIHFYNNFFGNLDHIYHPHEISAVIISLEMKNILLRKKSNNNCTAVSQLNKWLRTIS
tara:strand:- start:71 stop:1033 length:963 start_codon:yes stop_codon:yes gene_type:complete